MVEYVETTQAKSSSGLVYPAPWKYIPVCTAEAQLITTNTAPYDPGSLTYTPYFDMQGYRKMKIRLVNVVPESGMAIKVGLAISYTTSAWSETVYQVRRSYNGSIQYYVSAAINTTMYGEFGLAPGSNDTPALAKDEPIQIAGKYGRIVLEGEPSSTSDKVLSLTEIGVILW